jgi:hypothetical protein
MAVSKRLRYEVLRRDNHQCRYCGAAAPDVTLTVDHVLPVALGGADEAGNLVAACGDCNGGKSAGTPDAALVADVNDKAIRWSQAMQLAIERRAAELAENRAALHRFDLHWRAHQDADPTLVRLVHRDASWRASITQFMANGLDIESILDAVDAAMDARKVPDHNRWRYFCGICWREIKQLQEVAAHLAAEVGQPAPPVDEQLTYGPGFDPRFDTLNLAESYIAEVVEAVGAPDGVLKWATNGFWDAMEAGYKAFCRFTPSTEDDDPDVSANECAAEAFDRAAVESIAEIVILCHARVTHGS